MAQYNVSKREAQKYGIKRVKIGGGSSKKGSKKRKKDKRGGRYGKDTKNVISEILGATPAFQDVVKPFEEIYGEELQKEDQVQAEALMKPYFAQQISDTMEDLNAWKEMESVNYRRTLKQGRNKMAQLGAAIGSERTKWQGEVRSEKERRERDQVRVTERQVGTEEMRKAGFNPFYQNRVGKITDAMNTAIEEQKLWYRNQRAQRYYADARNKYRQEGGQTFGQKFQGMGIDQPPVNPNNFLR